MSDVHSSEASEACSYVALYLVYYFCVTVSDIEFTAKQNLYEQYWSLTKLSFTANSIMQLKATYAKQSLVNSLDLSLSRQHYAVCVGTLKFQPTMVLQSCFYCSQRKMVLSGVAGPGSCYFYPYGWEVMLILVRKTHSSWYVEVLTSNFFSHENLSSVSMAEVRNLFWELQLWFGFFPPSI